MNQNMVFVRGGKYLRGYDATQHIEYSPRHEVQISSFYFSKYLVTFEEFDKFCEETNREKPFDNGWGRGNRPVIDFEYNDHSEQIRSLKWDDIISYCNWLSSKEGLPPAYTEDPYSHHTYGYENDFWEILYKYYPNEYNEMRLKDNLSGNYYFSQWGHSSYGLLSSNGKLTLDITKVKGYRLPTDAEWEYAARGGKYSKGYIYAGSNNIDDVAVYYVHAYELPLEYDDPMSANHYKTQPVGSKMPNELGLYDMSGNVAEYCFDFSYPYEDFIKRGWVTNPIKFFLSYEEFEEAASINELNHVIRSGANKYTTKVFDRDSWIDYYVGFRIARSA